jgi:hypothetical protein
MVPEDEPRDEDGDSCGRPCSYDRQCDACSAYWERVVDEGLWDPVARCWTDKAVKEMAIKS